MHIELDLNAKLMKNNVGKRKYTSRYNSLKMETEQINAFILILYKTCDIFFCC